MKSLVVYDSWYNNTQQIAEAIADGLGTDVQAVKVDDDPHKYLEQCELLVIGSPTHGGVATPGMHEFLNSLTHEDLDGVTVATFDTRVTQRWLKFVGFAAPRIAQQLQQKGGRLAAAPEGFYVEGKEGPLKDGEVDRAKAWGVSVAQQVTSGVMA